MGGNRLYLIALFSSVLTLTACGGGSEHGANREPIDSGGDSGTGGVVTPTPDPDPGLDFDEENPGDNDYWIDEQVRGAVRPAYIGMGMVQAALDVAEGLTPYPAYIGENEASLSAATPEQPYTLSCPQSGAMSILDWRGASADGQLAVDEAVDFNFGDCAFVDPADPTGASYRKLSSSAPAAQTLSVVAAGESYTLDSVAIEGYSDLHVQAGDLLTASAAAGTRTVAPGAQTGLLQLSDTAGTGFNLFLGGDGQDLVEPYQIQVSDLGNGVKSIGIDNALVSVLDAEGNRSTYRVSTSSPLTVRETATGLQLVDLDPNDGNNEAGKMLIREVNGTARYTYVLAADPSCFWASIDSEGDGTYEASGQIDQNLILDRLQTN